MRTVKLKNVNKNFRVYFMKFKINYNKNHSSTSYTFRARYYDSELVGGCQWIDER